MTYRVLRLGKTMSEHQSAADLASWLQTQSLNDAPWKIEFDLPDNFDFKVSELDGERGQSQPQKLIVWTSADDCYRTYNRSTAEHSGDFTVCWDPDLHTPGMRIGFQNIAITFWQAEDRKTDRGVVWVDDGGQGDPFARLTINPDGVASTVLLVEAAESAIREKLVMAGEQYEYFAA